MVVVSPSRCRCLPSPPMVVVSALPCSPLVVSIALSAAHLLAFHRRWSGWTLAPTPLPPADGHGLLSAAGPEPTPADSLIPVEAVDLDSDEVYEPLTGGAAPAVDWSRIFAPTAPSVQPSPGRARHPHSHRPFVPSLSPDPSHLVPSHLARLIPRPLPPPSFLSQRRAWPTLSRRCPAWWSTFTSAPAATACAGPGRSGQRRPSRTPTPPSPPARNLQHAGASLGAAFSRTPRRIAHQRVAHQRVAIPPDSAGWR